MTRVRAAGNDFLMSDDTTPNAPVTDIKRTPIFGGGKAEKKKPQNEGLEIFKTIFYALLIALVLRVLLFQYQEEQIPLQELEAICKSGFAASGKST